jgi:hypothetical protein
VPSTVAVAPGTARCIENVMGEQVLEEAEQAGVPVDAKKFPLPNTYR